jgi:chemotaxis protein methyltransferase CheR
VPWLPPLSSSEFHELRRLFNAAAGLSFDSSALPVFQQRLASRLPLHEMDNFRDYLRLLQLEPESGSEMAAALDLVTSGETYFFRHDEQLQILTERILPAVAQNNALRRRISLWSAGCSSGEEAYTAAILLQESGLFPGWTVQIAGTDLSHERIEHARQGCYFQGAFRSTPTQIRDRYFVTSTRPSSIGRPRHAPNIWQIADQLRAWCQFSVVNLLQLGQPGVVPGLELEALSRRVDVILCRNVLLYLDQRARVHVLRQLYDRLAPGGFLLLGHSESLKLLGTPLDLESLPHDLAFRKPERPRRGAEP